MMPTVAARTIKARVTKRFIIPPSSMIRLLSSSARAHISSTASLGGQSTRQQRPEHQPADHHERRDDQKWTGVSEAHSQDPVRVRSRRRVRTLPAALRNCVGAMSARDSLRVARFAPGASLHDDMLDPAKGGWLCADSSCYSLLSLL